MSYLGALILGLLVLGWVFPAFAKAAHRVNRDLAVLSETGATREPGIRQPHTRY
ncbi:hypothetical protein Nm8I071_22170 [Nonomuraea sp. TT08I-71]|nr:hypothetical protein Nm8I071_22170 [Nonomuraea sp. TT08I-71]